MLLPLRWSLLDNLDQTEATEGKTLNMNKKWQKQTRNATYVCKFFRLVLTLTLIN